MEQRVAFRFVSDLLGDLYHVIEISGSSNTLYFESAIKTIKAGGECYAAIIEHYNTKAKMENSEDLKQMYERMAEENRQHFIESEVKRIHLIYETNKAKIQKQQYRDKSVIQLTNLIKLYLDRMMDDFKEIQKNMDFEKSDMVAENLRRALRDYKNIVRITNQGGSNYEQ